MTSEVFDAEILTFLQHTINYSSCKHEPLRTKKKTLKIVTVRLFKIMYTYQNFEAILLDLNEISIKLRYYFPL